MRVCVSEVVVVAPEPEITTVAEYVPTASDVPDAVRRSVAGAFVPEGNVAVSQPDDAAGLYVMLWTARLVSGKTPPFVIWTSRNAELWPATTRSDGVFAESAITAGGASATSKRALATGVTFALVN